MSDRYVNSRQVSWSRMKLKIFNAHVLVVAKNNPVCLCTK